MRKRAILIAAAFAALMFTVGGFAMADESVQKEQAKVKPGKLPKKGTKPIKLINTITTNDVPGTFQPPKATRTILDLPKQIKVNTKAAKYCKTDAAGLGSQPTVADAKRACGKKSQVSIDSGSSAEVRVGGVGGATVIPVDVAAFNEKGKKLLLYSKPTGAFQGIAASILVGKLKKFNQVKGRPAAAKKGSKSYKYSLDVSIPPLAAGAISFFKVTIKSGKYLSAKCKPKKMKFQATSFFNDGPNATVTDKDVQKCKPKGGKKRHK